MTRRVPSRRLVVDANVLASASRTDGGPPPGSIARAALTAILDICHRAVISAALRQEYVDHASAFGLRWLSAMTKKGKVVPSRIDRDADSPRARRWRQSAALRSAEQRAELAKDAHLLLAALETDRVVVSFETNARALFARVLSEADRPLGWAVVDHTTCAWLDAGAPLAPVVIDPVSPADSHARRKRSIPKPKAR